MVSAGLASLSCNYDLLSSVCVQNTMKVLCIRHGGGSLPLFLASKIPGVMVDIVETDPVIISTSTRAMGFLSYSIMKQLGDLLHPKLTIFDEILWRAVQERLHLYESEQSSQTEPTFMTCGEPSFRYGYCRWRLRFVSELLGACLKVLEIFRAIHV
nr:S-adenosyl-L-methionine-dependent methyltransferases superfamily protein [Tanacetum cinerariifolium]